MTRFLAWMGGCALVIAVLLAPRQAQALVLQAPSGGGVIELPKGRVLCAAPPDGWGVDATRRRVTTPPEPSEGQTVTVTIAPSAASCVTLAAEKVTLVVTGSLPVIDASSITLALDAGRLELHGDGLEGMHVEWRAGESAGHDTCLNVLKDKGRDFCTLSVDKSLPADPHRVTFRWMPRAGSSDPETITYDRGGNALSDDQMRLSPARVLLGRLFPLSHTVDVASGEGRVELFHPEAVSSVECAPARCEPTEKGFVVRAIPAAASSVTVRVHLAPRVFLTRGDTLDPTPTESLSILRCPLSIVSGDPMRNADSSSVLLRLDNACGADLGKVRWMASGEPAEVTRVESLPDGVYVLLWVPRISGERLTIVASRSDDGSVVAVTSASTWEAPALRTSVVLPSFGTIDFIPKNRDALLSISPAPRIGRFVPLSVPGAYTVTEKADGFHIRGELTTGGYTALKFGWRYSPVPAPFGDTNFAILTDPVQRPIHEASIPAPFGASSVTPYPIVELSCAVRPGKVQVIEPGTTPHIPFSERDSCRLVIHRERIPEEDGEQHINIDVSVTSVAGNDRGEAKLSQRLILRHGSEHDVIWIRGAKEQFDRINIRVTHIVEESQYITGSGRTELPSAQWTVVTETSKFKFYATAAIPASLFRFSNDPQDLGTGPLTLSFGLLSRLTWLDKDGKEGLLGLEAGMMAMGLATDKDRQLAIVTGLGFSIPLGNINQPTQASVNIHAWGSYTLGNRTGQLVDAKGNPDGTVALSHWALIFGPSITIGNVGTFL